MTDLLAGRLLIASSLCFHIIFAMLGIGMPLLMVIAEALWLKTKNPLYLEIAKRWSKITGITFAVGVVTGTLISFELGLLWPKFMAVATSIIGLPFGIEGFAFFLESIFLGIYLYGWDRVSPRMHLFSGFMVLAGATASGILITIVNGWMNTPAGFEFINGEVLNIQPWAAMRNPAALTECLHMTIAAFQSVGVGMAGVYAFLLLRQRDNAFYKKALVICFAVGAAMSFLQPFSGDASAKQLGKHQKVKLAAMEGQWETESMAPIRILGLPLENQEKTPFAIELPGLLSFLAYMNPKAEVMGLKDVPKDDRPPVALVHLSFQVMVGMGFYLMFVALLGGWLALRQKTFPLQNWFLRLVALGAPMGVIATEAGWIVTEVGRQPWIIKNVMRTSEALTQTPHLVIPLLVFLGIFALLSVMLFFILPKLIVVKEERSS